jgi:hypothetical protein
MTYQWASGGVMVTPSSVKMQTGWGAEVPPYQWENYIQNRQDNAITHLFQKGVSVWSATQDYYYAVGGTRAFVQGSDGKVYEAVANSTNQNPLTDTTNTYWKIAFRDQSGSALYALDTGTANVYKADYAPVVKTLVDGMVLKFKALNANTSTATFTPANGVIAAAPIVGGSHSALQGGEIAALGDVWVQWNTSIGGGSWVLIDSTGGALQVGAATKPLQALQLGQAQALFSPSVIGSSRNVKMSVPTASASATLTADEIILGTVLGGQNYRVASFSKTVNLATTGAGGMDTGTAPVSGFVSIYAIYNPTTLTSALLACAQATSNGSVYTGGNMPSGFTSSALVSSWSTNASSQFTVGYQVDRTVSFASIQVLSTTVQQGSSTSLSIAAAVPLNATKAKLRGSVASSTAAVVGTMTLAATATQIGISQLAAVLPTASIAFTAEMGVIPLLTPQTVYYTLALSTGAVSGANFTVTEYQF